jgi:hypothetical protein
MADMNVAALRVILDHLPDDLPVKIAGRGDLVSVRRHFDQIRSVDELNLDLRGPVFKGRCRDLRTLRVRLEALGET